MRKIKFLFIIFFACCCGIVQARQVKKIRIACIGNSITYGYGITEREKNSYPAQLQAMLGKNYQVMNFGVSATTLLSNGNKPYRNTPEYKKALESAPDIVTIKLGTNDSKLVNRVKIGQFEHDYEELVGSFSSLPSHPRIILLLPVPSFVEDTSKIWDPVIKNQIIPHIRQVAFNKKLEVIDLYQLLVNRPELFPDKIHPSAEGATIIARRLKSLIEQKKDERYNILNKIQADKQLSSFYGYECADFVFNKRKCKVVRPKWAAQGHPWVWRARFFGHEPQTDIALLERGFHIVYCDVVELFGNQEAITAWNGFYSLLRKSGLAKKAALEGMSRGGVYVYNWAAENPEKVLCVYADNPVLDLKSWPGGKGKGPGAKKEWETFKRDYGYINDEEAMKFAGSPIDKVKAIVKGGYPMLHVCGDADEVVPMQENTIPFEQKVRQLGGNIMVIHKPEGKHHPHSLPNPTPIVEFILKAGGYSF